MPWASQLQKKKIIWAYSFWELESLTVGCKKQIAGMTFEAEVGGSNVGGQAQT